MHGGSSLLMDIVDQLRVLQSTHRIAIFATVDDMTVRKWNISERK